MKKSLSLILALTMLIGMLPQVALLARAEETETITNGVEGKTISILGDSISTYTGISNSTSANSTIGSNDIYYTEGRHNVYQKDTWWQQTIDALGMELLVNNSWSGSCVFMPRKGAASVGYGDRAVNLHNDHTGEEPDIIFVFLGTNDFAYFKDTFGKATDVNYTALIQDNGDGTYTYAVPSTTCEAYAIMLHKAKNRYPDADIYCMTPTARRDPDYAEDGRADTGQPTAYSAELHKVATHFGFPVVDLENCIPKDAEIFDQYMGDKRVHPNALGMDRITNEVLSVMLGTEAQICHVTSADDIVAEQAVLLGGSYNVEVELQEGYSVVVTMDGKDITNEVYNDGKIHIKEVTGDITVSAVIHRQPQNFRWEVLDNDLVSVSDTVNTANNANKLAGSIYNGMLESACFELDSAVILKHDLPWTVEWRCAGDWRGMLFSSDPVKQTKGMYYLYRTKGGQLCFGTWTGSQHSNYGIDLSHLDDQVHTYQLVNQIADGGSNMVWLYVDGEEIGPMNNYYIGSNDQVETSDWISGKDFIFNYIGTDGFPVNNCVLEYLQVCANSHEHIYESVISLPTCTEQGFTTYTCACGDSYEDDYVDPTGKHTYENGTCATCGVADPSAAPARLYMYSISLKGNIAINYYMELSAAVLADETAFMRFSFTNGTTAEIPLSQAVRQSYKGKDYYVFSCAVAAKEMTDVVKAQFFYDGGSTVEYGYNVQSYAQYFLENSTDEGLKTLVAAMLNYGAASQLHFGYSTDNPANDCLNSVPDYSDVSIDGFTTVAGQGTELAKFYSASLILKSETTLRFFFTGSFRATYNGKALEVKERGGLYYADVVGISAKDLDEDVTITIHDGVSSADVTFNPMAYCAAVRNDESGAFDQRIKDLVSALYLYNQAANQYLEEN